MSNLLFCFFFKHEPKERFFAKSLSFPFILFFFFVSVMGFAEFVYPKDLLYEVASVANDTLTGTNENNNGTDWLQGFFDFYYNNPVPLGLGFFSILYGLSLIAVVFLVCFSTTREFSVNPPCPLSALCKRLEKSMKNGRMQWKLVDPKDSCLF